MRPYLLLLLFLLSATPARAGLPVADSQGEPLPTLAPMLERTIPGVVNIYARSRVTVREHPLLADPFFRDFLGHGLPRQREQQNLGSGVVMDAERGYIITNHHVIEGAESIAITLADGRTVSARLVGSDPETDIAVLQVAAGGLSAIPSADSDTLRVGDFVVAIGNPFGLGQTVTSGIVSALGRSGLGIEGYEDFIQTDTAINPGNSGGALVNLRGELVGINTAILSRSGGNVGIGFAIPINMAREVMGQLVEHGEVRRGYLGAQAQDLTPELAAAFGLQTLRGAVVTEVGKGSPAARGGLQSGDVIVAIDGRAVDNAADVRNAIGLLRVGQTVTVEVLRDGQRQRLTLRIEAPRIRHVDGAELHPRLQGAVLGELPPGSELPGAGEGVVVLELERGSRAAALGLRQGDRITEANRHPVDGLASLQQALNGRGLMLQVQREGMSLLLMVR